MLAALRVVMSVSLQADSLVVKMVLSKVGMWVVEMVELMAASMVISKAEKWVSSRVVQRDAMTAL